MFPWKVVALVVLALMPGGSLLLLVLAAFKAVQLGKSRLPKASPAAGDLSLAIEAKGA